MIASQSFSIACKGPYKIFPRPELSNRRQKPNIPLYELTSAVRVLPTVNALAFYTFLRILEIV